jgi:tyrosine-protein phosphatase YwqE
MGCFLQLNLLSIGGFYGQEVKAQAENLLDNDLIDFVSTDIHKPKQLDMIDQILRSRIWGKLQKYDFNDVFFND